MPLFLNFRSLLHRHLRQPSVATIQDTSQFYNLPLHACSDSVVQVASDVMESEAGGTVKRDSPQLYQPFLYLDANVVEAICKTEIRDDEGSMTQGSESEAVRLLAARIPPELFDDILFYVNVDRVSQRQEYLRNKGSSLTRNQGQPSPIDILTDLKQCSLVCLFWANRCREYIFQNRPLEINSYEDAEIFKQYVIGGCPRLTPVHQLIIGIDVHQDYESGLGRSFLHLLNLPIIQDKLDSFSIIGPVPEGFNPAKLDTPHWGIPPRIVVPSSFLQKQIILENVHLPSFYHVTKYIRHFFCADEIHFEDITWSGQTPYTLPHVSSTISCQRRPRSLEVTAEGVCTDSVHLALTALMLNPNCPLHRLSDDERVWMLRFITLLWAQEKNVSMEFDVSEQATTMRMHPFYFVFEEASASTDRSTSARSVVGMHAYIDNHDGRDLPANFDALVDHARTHPTIRALVVLFDSSDCLQKSIKPFVEVLQIAMAPENVELVLAYMEMRGKAVGVDLVTLKTNGRIWLGVHWSDDILRQELKKRR